MSVLIIRPSVCVHTHRRFVERAALRLMIEAGNMRAEGRLAAVEDRHAVEFATRHQRPTEGGDRPSASTGAGR